jgi:hypothetical protein
MPLATPHDIQDHPASSLPAVTGRLQFAVPAAAKPYAYAIEPPAGVPPRRGDYREQDVPIRNARPQAGRFSLDVEGFAVVRHRSAVADFFDEAQTLALGHPETAQLVQAATGASRVVVFDHTLRRRVDGAPAGDRSQPQPPSIRLHVDQTLWSGPKRVREIMGEQAEALLGGRTAIINVWRPIAHAARDWPLVLGDATSIAADDLIPTDLIFAHRRGETYAIAHDPDQRWYYIPDLQPDDAILIKCWDSDPTVARFTPHSAFDDPTTPPGTPPRQSIEFRTIAFFD